MCVFVAPVFSSLTSISAYMFTKEVTGRSQAGLFSALFMSLVPSYISRSVAGSYDNEAVSIFALLLTFQLYIKAVNTVIIIITNKYYHRDHCFTVDSQPYHFSTWSPVGEDTPSSSI